MKNERTRSTEKIMFEGRRLLEASPENTLVLMPFGSVLYGLETEDSDLDFKGVYVPSLEEVLERKERESMRLGTRKKEKGERNGPGDVDCELFSFGRFAAHALTGQTLAFDMLHAPEERCIAVSEIWNEIVRNRHLFLSKRIMRFVEYARNQAKKYGIKGSRLAFVDEALGLLGRMPPDERLDAPGRGRFSLRMFEIEDTAKRHVLSDGKLFASVLPETRVGEPPVVEICGKRFPGGAKVRHVVESLGKIRDSLGGRSEDAAKSGGVDWKAVSHAFRALSQAKLLATDGEFSYPLPDSEFLMRIKLGKENYDEVGPMLEAELERVRDLVERSSLPEKPVEEVYFFVEGLRNEMYGKNAGEPRL